MAVGFFWAAKLWGATLEKGKAQNQVRRNMENTEGAGVATTGPSPGCAPCSEHESEPRNRHLWALKLNSTRGWAEREKRGERGRKTPQTLLQQPRTAAGNTWEHLTVTLRSPACPCPAGGDPSSGTPRQPPSFPTKPLPQQRLGVYLSLSTESQITGTLSPYI